MSERLLVIAGPSGVGKTSVVAAMAQLISLKRVITCTTRDPRTDEVDGVHYRFLTRENFLLRLSRHEFAEHAIIHQNLYGTLREDINHQVSCKEAVLLILDIQGVEAVIRLYPDAQTFFLTAPMAQLIRRLNQRETDQRLLKLRIKALREELLGAKSPAIKNIISNGDGELEKAAQQICDIVQKNIGYSLKRKKK